jgi:hypothetical protein
MTPHRVSTILDAAGRPMLAGRVSPETDPLVHRHFVHDPANPTHRDWTRFCNWRITKTPHRNRADMIERIEDLDHATHELVGAVAGLGDCILAYGVAVRSDKRDAMMGELGDVFFTGSWAADAWGVNRLREGMVPPPAEFVPVERLAEIEPFSLADDEGSEAAGLKMMHLAFQVQTLAGLACNAFKEARWHRRVQSAQRQGDTIAHALLTAGMLAAVAGLTVEECLQSNIAKLDARFPDGFAVGGGIRSGEGA